MSHLTRRHALTHTPAHANTLTAIDRVVKLLCYDGGHDRLQRRYAGQAECTPHSHGGDLFWMANQLHWYNLRNRRPQV